MNWCWWVLSCCGCGGHQVRQWTGASECRMVVLFTCVSVCLCVWGGGAGGGGTWCRLKPDNELVLVSVEWLCCSHVCVCVGGGGGTWCRLKPDDELVLVSVGWLWLLALHICILLLIVPFVLLVSSFVRIGQNWFCLMLIAECAWACCEKFVANVFGYELQISEYVNFGTHGVYLLFLICL